MKFETALLLSIGSGDAEHEFKRLVVEYRYVKGYPQRQTEPGEPEHCVLGNVYALIDGARHPLPEWMVEPLTDQLEAMALDIYRGERDDALERRAEARRDDAMLDRVPAHVTRAAE